MRVALGLVIAFSVSSSANARLNWSQYEIPPAAHVIPLEAGVSLVPLSLTRMAANLRDGEVWAELWRICDRRPDRVLTWQAKNNQFNADPELEALFRQELTSAGFKVSGASTDLFQAEGPSADLEIGALITNLHIRECYYSLSGDEQSGPFHQVGVVTMAIEWQIYSVSQAKVIARIPTEGGFKDKQTGALLSPYIAQAFAENVRQLAGNPEFRHIATSQPAALAAPKAAPIVPIAIHTTASVLPLGEAAKGAVSVIVAGGWGSGVLISDDGYVLTNHHVAGDSGRVRIRWANGTESVGEVVRADRRRDVALIKAEAPQGVALAIRARSVDLGETVYAIGTPREREFAGTLTRGVVSAVDRRVEGQRYIQSDVAITHGNSGGPLLDEKGAIVGLSDMVYEPDGVSQNINFSSRSTRR